MSRISCREHKANIFVNNSFFVSWIASTSDLRRFWKFVVDASRKKESYCNQDFKTTLAWIISYEQIKSGSRVLPGFA